MADSIADFVISTAREVLSPYPVGYGVRGLLLTDHVHEYVNVDGFEALFTPRG